MIGRSFKSMDSRTQKLLCKAQLYGRLMQVKADSFLPNSRFNLAMGLATIHVGQHLRKIWMSGKKSGTESNLACIKCRQPYAFVARGI